MIPDHQRLRRIMPHEGQSLGNIIDHVIQHEPRRILFSLLQAKHAQATGFAALFGENTGRCRCHPRLPSDARAGSIARMAVKDAFAPLVDLIYPPRCPLCGEAIAAQKGLCIAVLVRAGDTARKAADGDRCRHALQRYGPASWC